MNLSDVYAIRVPRKERRRVGRGWGSGIGKTSGRGEKGAGRRSGTAFRLRFEGGQMPLYRRLPKKGFSNHPFRLRFEAVNVGSLESAFDAGATVDIESLRGARLVPKHATLWKLLGDGELKKALTVKADAASAGAREKVTKAGGTLEVVAGAAKERLEGVVVRRAKTSEKRGKAIEAYKAEAVKVGKPAKKTPTQKAAKGVKAERPAKAAPAGEAGAKGAGTPSPKAPSGPKGGANKPPEKGQG
jgi:large subunit ribosomal protein L15